MAIEAKDLYAHAFETLRHASDFRAKIIGGWAAMYTAFGAVFVWAKTNSFPLAWVSGAAALMTVLMWLADLRNRPAIERAKLIGQNIEKNEKVADALCFFSTIEEGPRHGWLIDLFGALSFLGFFIAWLVFRT